MSVVRRVRCRVAAVADHGEHVFSVDLAPETSVPAFLPGQFLHLALDEYDPSRHWPESRAFSIASSPGDTGRIRILYSAAGTYTRRMERELSVGRAVSVKLPYGEFIVDGGHDAVLLAGGTGISAFLAFLQRLKPDHPRQVLLAYGTRSPELMILRAAVLDLVARIPAVSAIFFAESAPPNFPSAVLPAAARVEHRIGRIAIADIWPLLQEPLGRTYYLSGPPQMSAVLSAELLARGVPPASIRTDAWE
jgi:ferredoxin-NADP reductase